MEYYKCNNFMVYRLATGRFLRYHLRFHGACCGGEQTSTHVMKTLPDRYFQRIGQLERSVAKGRRMAAKSRSCHSKG